MATSQDMTKASEVPIDRQSEIDEKEQVDHLEAAPRSSDPKVAALQDGIEALHRLTPEEYDALHKKLVRKVGGERATFSVKRVLIIRLTLDCCQSCLSFLFSITSTGMLWRMFSPPQSSVLSGTNLGMALTK